MRKVIRTGKYGTTCPYGAKINHRSEYHIWRGMIDRCFNKNNRQFKDYGGRGITISKSWLCFENFIRDMGPRPDGLTVERINVNGNYEAANCRWATRLEQGANTRRNRFIEIGEKKKTMSEWAREATVSRKAFERRINNGMSPKDALIQPSKLNPPSLRGVYLQRNKWCASIAFNRRRWYLGSFQTQAEAGYARMQAKHNLEKFGNPWGSNEHAG